MAKKVVATLQKGKDQKFAKFIRCVKTAKGDYGFQSEILSEADVKKYLK